jgi:hypothetical protein
MNSDQNRQHDSTQKASGMAANFVRAWSAWVLLLFSASAFAHQASSSFLTLKVDNATVAMRWDIALRDADRVLHLDTNGDGTITWGEVRVRETDLLHYAHAHLQVSSDGQPCPASSSEPLMIDTHSDGTYAVLQSTLTCAAPVSALDISYHFLFDLDPTHRGLLNLQYGKQTQSDVFGPETQTRHLLLQAPSKLRLLGQYMNVGIWHIWTGYDHMLFLLTLLLPAVMIYRPPSWQPVERLRPAAVDMLKTVTAFTLAHSITLTLAVLGIVRPSPPVIEALIAFSILITALNNLRPTFTHARWFLAFGFGLIHGFGFANVLVDLALPRTSLAIALAGFNLGVECGQMVIVMIAFPLIYVLRRKPFYLPVILRGGSALAGVMAGVWMVQRLAVL